MHLWELLLYCTSHNCENYQFYCFYKMPKKSQIASHYCQNYLFYTFHLVAKKSRHITAKMANFIFSTHCPENHYCKNYQFYIFHPLARKPSLRKLPILYLPLSAKKNMTAKITNFIFPARIPERNYQFYISRPVPRKSSNLSQLTVCLRVSGEKKRKEEANPNILKQSRSTNNSKNIEFMITMWSLVFQLDLEMSYDKRQANA